MRVVLLIIGALVWLPASEPGEPSREKGVDIQVRALSPETRTGQSPAAPVPNTEPNPTVVLDEIELRTLRQDDGFNAEFYNQRREDLRDGPWHPYDLGTRSE